MEKINFLVFDSSSHKLKIGLSYGNKRNYIELDKGYNHIENLIPSVDQCFKDLNADKNNLDIAGVCIGPGSFTGLRIGIAAALGITYASGIKCFGFSVFDVYQFLYKDQKDSVVIPVIDAKKSRFYTAFINGKGAVKMYDIEPEMIIQKIKGFKNKKKIIFTGRDFSLIAGSRLLDEINYSYEYKDDYSALDEINFAEHILKSGRKLKRPDPVYLRKSEAEIMLLKNKNIKSGSKFRMQACKKKN